MEQYTEDSWGMEGEATICVRLYELGPSRQLNRQIQALVNASKHKANVKFIASCKKDKGTDPFNRY